MGSEMCIRDRSIPLVQVRAAAFSTSWEDPIGVDDGVGSLDGAARWGGPHQPIYSSPLGDILASIFSGLASPSGCAAAPVLSPLQGELTVINGEDRCRRGPRPTPPALLEVEGDGLGDLPHRGVVVDGSGHPVEVDQAVSLTMFFP